MKKQIFMTPLTHLIFSIIPFILASQFYGWNSLWIFVGGVLIDWDHYVYYIFQKKDINIIRSYRYFRSLRGLKKLAEYKKVFRFFHTIEFLIVIVILSFYSEIFFLILIGILTHYILDVINEIRLFKELNDWFLILWLNKIFKK